MDALKMLIVVKYHSHNNRQFRKTGSRRITQTDTAKNHDTNTNNNLVKYSSDGDSINNLTISPKPTTPPSDIDKSMKHKPSVSISRDQAKLVG